MGRELYLGKPGDDTTVAVAHVLQPQRVSMFSGPPKKPEDDKRIVDDFMTSGGIRVVSGGTTAEILARELERPLEVSIDYASDLPPVAKIRGIDLVTEGVMTIKRVLELLDEYIQSPASEEMLRNLDQENGASRLARILIERCTDLHLFIGKAVNPAHQNQDFPVELRVKFRLLDDLAEKMTQMGRHVEKKYY